MMYYIYTRNVLIYTIFTENYWRAQIRDSKSEDYSNILLCLTDRLVLIIIISYSYYIIRIILSVSRISKMSYFKTMLIHLNNLHI